MVQENQMYQDSTQKTFKKIKLVVSPKTISFGVLDTISNKITHLKRVTIPTQGIIEEAFWKIIVDNPVLNEKFDSVLVLHDTSNSTLVPTSLFDANFMGNYLQYNSKVFETDYFAYDYIDTYDLNNVFIPYTHINNYLLDHFDGFDYKNSNSIFIKKALDLSKNKDFKQVFLHFQDEKFELVVTKNQQVILFNSFEHKTIEDFIYFILFNYEQLQLNPEIVPIHLLGNINEDSDYFKVVYRYIRHCELLNVEDLATYYNISKTEALTHFILLHG